ncbi:DUF4397 domain-containing protein [Pontibacter sp. SGAir0037]|uniref:DUF4397 domain-containing protein n=1 Tax=Pontibacter sp. SGAir0037 TaxID=2571030 RepID=UPI0010CD4D95|nr:DUF4397 domain-containing protein [Pontibacter sp. SGAir0037]QCR23495.1 cell wall anchor protein [Pontibacter sp. SGAir0037]
MKKLLRPLLLILLPALALSSCNDDDTTEPTVYQAQVMAVHASPDAPGVDLLVDDVKVNSSALVYPNNTNYLEVPEGTRNIKVNAAGTSTSVIDADLDLERNKFYTIFAADMLSEIKPIVLEDDLTMPASGQSHVRFVHLSPDAPAVDVAVQGGPVLFSNRSFESATAFTPVAGGTYNLEVRPAGSTDVVLSVPNVQLQAGKIYTIFARGFLTPPNGNNDALGAQVIVNR